MLFHVKSLLPFLGISTFFLIYLIFVFVCHGDPGISNVDQPILQSQGIVEENLYAMDTREVKKRSLLADNRSMILAAKRTHRKDPLDGFKYYNGGWDIGEKHYFSSVAYTAAPVFVIAVFWFLAFAVILLIICVRHCCCKLEDFGYSKTTCMLSLVFFAVVTIAGCIFLFTGQVKLNSSSVSTLKFIVNRVDDTVQNLTIVSKSLSAAKSIGVDQIDLPPEVKDSIDKVGNMINSAATTLERKTNRNSDKIHKVLDYGRVALIVVASVMLILAFLGLLSSILGFQTSVHILTTMGWIIVTIALIICCLFVILNNVAGDTCIAMDEWVQIPTAHTALDDIIPCIDNATAQETLAQSKQVTYQLAHLISFFITNVSNKDPPKNLPPDLPPKARLLYYNQSGPLLPALCNPFNADITDRTCAPGEVDFSNASQEWKKYICETSPNGTCISVGRLTQEFYNQMTYTVNIGFTLHHYGSFLVKIVDCTFVRETFNAIYNYHCPDLDRYSEWVYIGLAIVSSALMLSLLNWMFYTRQKRHEMNAKQFGNLPSQDPSEVGP